MKPHEEIGPPNFLQDFLNKTQEKVADFLTDHQKRARFEAHGNKNTRVREGHPADFLRRDLQLKASASRHILDEWRQHNLRGETENFHREQILAKIPEFYEAQVALFSRYAEVADDPKLAELAAIYEAEMPILKVMYDKYKENIVANTQ